MAMRRRGMEMARTWSCNNLLWSTGTKMMMPSIMVVNDEDDDHDKRDL